MEILDALTNREIAVAVWLVILSIWILSKGSARIALSGILKILFSKKIFLSILFILFYSLLTVVILMKTGFWNVSASKDTVFWFFGVAIVMFFNINKSADDNNFLKSTIVDQLKLIVILEFVLNLYAFNLITELIVVPVVSIIVMVCVYASLKPEYKQIKTLLDYVLAFFGLVLVVFTIREIVSDFQNFATLKNLRDFLLPLVFTLAFLPAIYLLALLVQYESLFTRISIVNKNPDLARYAKWKIFLFCRLNLRKLNKFSKNVRILRVNSKEEVQDLIDQFRSE